MTASERIRAAREERELYNVTVKRIYGDGRVESTVWQRFATSKDDARAGGAKASRREYPDASIIIVEADAA